MPSSNIWQYKFTFSSVITGEVTALNDLWIVGDQFLQRNYHMFPSMRDEARISRQPIPYCFEYFNVSSLYAKPQSLVKDMLAKFQGALVSGLNNTSKLPRILVVVPDEDILKFVNFATLGTRFVLGAAISWIVTQFN